MTRPSDPEPDEKVMKDKADAGPKTKSAPKEEPPGEQTRVLLTGDNRNVVTEEWIPTAEFGFRINVRGQHFEHVGEAADSGTWIFAPTR